MDVGLFLIFDIYEWCLYDYKKQNKETEVLRHSIKQLDLTCMYRILGAIEYMFFSMEHSPRQTV